MGHIECTMSSEDETYIDVEALKIKTPKPEGLVKRSPEWLIKRSVRYCICNKCGTVTFLVIQAFLICAMVKASISSPITIEEFVVFFGSVFTVYASCIVVIMRVDGHLYYAGR